MKIVIKYLIVLIFLLHIGKGQTEGEMIDQVFNI